jgi:hypothetical protein
VPTRRVASLILVECQPLLILAAALAFYGLGNGAMLPLYGLAVVAAKQGEAASFVALATVIAQGAMILVALVAIRMAEKEGYWFVLLISFLALPIRGLIAALVINQWGLQQLNKIYTNIIKFADMPRPIPAHEKHATIYRPHHEAVSR